jgi:hypothetical protein
MEQRNIYDKIASSQRPGAGVVNTQFIFSAAEQNTFLSSTGPGGDPTTGPLNKLVPDYMRCPSSPIPVMAEQTGSITLPTYVGIGGGTDIDPGNQTLYPNQLWGRPTSNRIYRNRYQKTITVNNIAGLPPATDCVFANSGMLPIGEHKNMASCTDGTSNTMIVGEQSDWLRDVDASVSTKYHGDPGWNGPGGPGSATGTDRIGGWLTGTNQVSGMQALNNFICDEGAFNVTTVRYKPDLKRVIDGASGGGAPGCAEILGHNNPLQSAHPGGILVAFVDGSVQFIPGTTGLEVLLRLAIREDGQNVKLDN